MATIFDNLKTKKITTAIPKSSSSNTKIASNGVNNHTKVTTNANTNNNSTIGKITKALDNLSSGKGVNNGGITLNSQYTPSQIVSKMDTQAKETSNILTPVIKKGINSIEDAAVDAAVVPTKKVYNTVGLATNIVNNVFGTNYENPVNKVYKTANKVRNSIANLFIGDDKEITEGDKIIDDYNSDKYLNIKPIQDKVKEDNTYFSKLYNEDGTLVDYTDKLADLKNKMKNPYTRSQYESEYNELNDILSDQQIIKNSSYLSYLEENGASDKEIHDYKQQLIREGQNENFLVRLPRNIATTVEEWAGNKLAGADAIEQKFYYELGIDYENNPLSEAILSNAEQEQAEVMASANGAEKFIYNVYNGMSEFVYDMVALSLTSGANYLGNVEEAEKLTNGALLMSDVGVLGAKTRENQKNGYDFETSFDNALLYAAINHLTESIGGEKMAQILTGGEIPSKMLETTWKYLTKSAGQMFAAEALEEGYSAILEPIADWATLNTGMTVGDYFNQVFSKDTAYQMLVGGLGGLAMGIGGSVSTVENYNASVEIIKESIPMESVKDYNTAQAIYNKFDEMIAATEANENENDRVAVGMLKKAFAEKMSEYREKHPTSFAITSESDNFDASILDNPDQFVANAVRPTVAKTLGDLANTTKSIELQSQADVEKLQSQLSEELKGTQVNAFEFANWSEDVQENAINIANVIDKLGKSKNTIIAIITDADGNQIDGCHVGDKYVVNPNSQNGVLDAIVHEYTHGLEGTKFYPIIDALVKSYWGEEYESKIELIKNEYKTIKQVDANGNETVVELSDEDARKEAVAHSVAMLLGNQEFVDRLVRYNSALAYNMYENIKMANQNAGGIVENIEYAFMKAFKDNAKVQSQDEMQLSKGIQLQQVERNKDLIAAHNLSEEKLINSLDLGGFAMPSIAIKKDSMPHADFGDITLVFDKSTIDPKKSKNDVYSGDAWTGVYPTVDYDVKYKTVDKVHKYLNNIEELRYLEDIDNNSTISNLSNYGNLNDLLKVNNGNIMPKLQDSDVLKYLYLKENGIVVDKPYDRKSVFGGDDYSKDQEIINKVIGLGFTEDEYRNGFEDVQKYIEPIREIANEYYAEKYPQLNREFFTEDDWGYSKADKYMRAAFDYLRHGEDSFKYTFDKAKFETNLNEAINKYGANFDNDFKNWINDNILSQYEVSKGIRNDNDLFNWDGSRRTFKQTHDEYNLKNVFKYMSKQSGSDSRGKHEGAFGIGTGDTLATQLKRFDSIEDIIENEAMLQDLSDEEYSQVYKPLRDELYDIYDEVYESFNKLPNETSIDIDAQISYDNNSKEFVKNAIQLHTKAQMENMYKNEFEPWDTLNIDENKRNEIYDTILQFKQKLSNLPTKYFEAKPRRIVGLNEISQAVIPNTSSQELIDKLNENGINYTMYNPSIDGDRQNVINKVANEKQLKFSKGISLQQDQDYINAVNNNDTQKAQELVEEAAKIAFPNSKRIVEGEFRKLWHHTNEKFTEFLPGLSPNNGVKGINFAASPDGNISSRLGKYHNAYYVNITNPLFSQGYPAHDEYVDKLIGMQEGVTDRNELAKINKQFMDETGFDGVIVPLNGWWIALDSNQIKSADPITYDDQGNVIPLSERFNTSNDDVRYSKGINLNNEESRKEAEDYVSSKIKREFKVNNKRIDVSKYSNYILDDIKQNGFVMPDTVNDIIDNLVPELEMEKVYNDNYDYIKKIRDEMGGNFLAKKGWDDTVKTLHEEYGVFTDDEMPLTYEDAREQVQNYLLSLGKKTEYKSPVDMGYISDEEYQEDVSKRVYDFIDNLTDDINQKIDDQYKADVQEVINNANVGDELTVDDISNFVKDKQISKKSLEAIERNKKVFEENTDKWVKGYDTIRAEYPIFSKSTLSTAIFEIIDSGDISDSTRDKMANTLSSEYDQEGINGDIQKDIDSFIKETLETFKNETKYNAGEIDKELVRKAMKFNEAYNQNNIEQEYANRLSGQESNKRSSDRKQDLQREWQPVVDELIAADQVARESKKAMKVDASISHWKTIDQNISSIANGNLNLYQTLKKKIRYELLDNAATTKNSVLKNAQENVVDKVKELGINEGSKENVAVQYILEGHTEKLRTDIDVNTKVKLPDGTYGIPQETLAEFNARPFEPYTETQLKKDYDYEMANGKKAWENIKEAANIIRDAYDDTFFRVTRSQIDAYGDVEGNADYETAKLLVEVDKAFTTMETIKDEIRRNGSKESTQAAFEIAKQKYNQLQTQYNARITKDENGDLTRRQLTPYRQNYSHHVVKNSLRNTFNSIKNAESMTPTELAGTSDFTNPNTAWATFSAAQDSLKYNPTALGSYTSYMVDAANVISYNPVILSLRQFNKDIKATATGTTLNKFSEYLNDYCNMLAGKRNNLDRVIQKGIGAKTMKTISALNNYAKATALTANVRSGLVQFANIPNGLGILEAQGGKGAVTDVANGIKDWVHNLNNDGVSPIDLSPFMNNRYFGFDTGKNGFGNKVKNVVDAILITGDKIGAETIWWSAYEQANRLNPELEKFDRVDAIKYADDITRSAIAGRTKEDLAIAMNSQVINLLFPFQVENNNLWQTIKEEASNREFGAIATYNIAAFIFNALIKGITNGDDEVLPEVITPLYEEIRKALKGKEDANEAAQNILFGEIGEFISLLPYGQWVTQLTFGDDSDTVFGDYNPNRYGTTNIGVSGFRNMVVDMINDSGDARQQALDIIENLVAGYAPAGKQIMKTVEGLQSMGGLPDYKGGEIQMSPVNYTSSGNVAYVNDQSNIPDWIRAALFGKYATSGANSYTKNGFNSLSKTAGNIFNLLSSMDENGNDAYEDYKQAYEYQGEKSSKVDTTLREDLIRDGKYGDYKNAVSEAYADYLNEWYNEDHDEDDSPRTFTQFASSYGLSSDDLKQDTYDGFYDTYDVDEDVQKQFSEALEIENSKNALNKTIANSGATQRRVIYEQLGIYDDILEYIEANGLDYTDFGLTKTVVGYDQSDINKMLAKINGETYTEDEEESSSKKSSDNSSGSSSSSSAKAIRKKQIAAMKKYLNTLNSNDYNIFKNVNMTKVSDAKSNVKKILEDLD